MFKRILLPLDLTDKHQAALHTAAEFARLHGAEVILLHVVELIPGLGRGEEEAFYRRLERLAFDHLRRLGASLAQQQIRFQAEVIFGNRVADTAAFAAQRQADLIILTSPPFQPDRPVAGLGSMAWRISLVAGCPVLLVKNPQPS